MSISADASGPRHSVSVAAVTLDRHGRILLIQRRDSGAWQPPGGVLERDETFEDGLRREVFEETGVHVAVDRLTGVYKNLTLAVVALVFRCHPITGAPGPTSEARDVRWMDPPQALALMQPAFAVRIRDALDNGTVPARIHDGTRLLPTTAHR